VLYERWLPWLPEQLVARSLVLTRLEEMAAGNRPSHPDSASYWSQARWYVYGARRQNYR
jgi:hypothetical protein